MLLLTATLAGASGPSAALAATNRFRQWERRSAVQEELRRSGPHEPTEQSPPARGGRALAPPQQLLYRCLHIFSLGEVMHPKVAVFMVGLPGAGKSRIIDLRYATDHRRGKRRVATTVVVDLDREMALHPEFDPKDPDRLYLAKGQEAYRWADARVEERFATGLREPSVRRLVIDGTGTNVERQIRRMRAARSAGFFVKALYVRVPARTAIVRAAMRKRGVSPDRIHKYQAKMKLAMEVAKQHADEVEIVDVTFDDAPLPGSMHGYVDPITSIVF